MFASASRGWCVWHRALVWSSEFVPAKSSLQPYWGYSLTFKGLLTVNRVNSEEAIASASSASVSSYVNGMLVSHLTLYALHNMATSFMNNQPGHIIQQLFLQSIAYGQLALKIYCSYLCIVGINGCWIMWPCGVHNHCVTVTFIVCVYTLSASAFTEPSLHQLYFF